MKYLIGILMLAMVPAAGSAEEITLAPGRLGAVVRTLGNVVPELKLSGEVSSHDLSFFKLLPEGLARLDLSALQLEGDSLPSYTFLGSRVREVTLPVSIKKIGEGAFAGSSVEGIVLPESLEMMAPRVFYKCQALENVDAASSRLKELPEESFCGCSNMRTISLPGTLTKLGSKALSGSGIGNLSLPGVLEIGAYALADMPNLSSITLPDGVMIEEGAFFNNPLLMVVSAFPGNAPAIAYSSSSNIKLPDVIDIPKIEEGAFASTDREDIALGQSVKEIARHAFRHAGNLKRVDVTRLGGEIPVADAEAFSGIDVSGVALTVSGLREPWEQAPVWKDFKIMGGESYAAPVADEIAGMVVGCEDRIVHLKCAEGFAAVSIYSPDGMILYDVHDCGTEVSAGPFDAQEVIVVAKTAGENVKVKSVHLLVR